jgi:hypothetical protein
MTAQSAAAVARSGACSIQTISSRSLPETGTVHARATRPGNRERIISESYRDHADEQTVVRKRVQLLMNSFRITIFSVAKKNVSSSGQQKPLTMQ